MSCKPTRPVSLGLMIASWGKTTIVAAIVLLVAGCASTEVSSESPEEQETSWADLNSCNAMQQIVWSLDNSPSDALDSISDQEQFLSEGPESNAQIVQTVFEYSNHLRDLIETNSGSQTLLDVLESQTQAEYETDQEIHGEFAVFCDSIGFTIFDDSFLSSDWEPVDEERTTAEESPTPTETSGAANTKKCFENMKQASLEINSTIAEKLLKKTAEYCGGESEWYQALRMYPYAMGFSDVVGNELDILCNNYPTATACRNP